MSEFKNIRPTLAECAIAALDHRNRNKRREITIVIEDTNESLLGHLLGAITMELKQQCFTGDDKNFSIATVKLDNDPHWVWEPINPPGPTYGQCSRCGHKGKISVPPGHSTALCHARCYGLWSAKQQGW